MQDVMQGPHWPHHHPASPHVPTSPPPPTTLFLMVNLICPNIRFWILAEPYYSMWKFSAPIRNRLSPRVVYRTQGKHVYFNTPSSTLKYVIRSPE